MRSFLVGTLLLALVQVLASYFIFNQAIGFQPNSVVYFFPFFFIGIFGLVHWQLIKALEKEPKRFVTIFMGATGAKMMVALFTILIISLVLKTDYKHVAVCFIAEYLLFMALEVVFVLKELKTNPTSPK